MNKPIVATQPAFPSPAIASPERNRSKRTTSGLSAVAVFGALALCGAASAGVVQERNKTMAVHFFEEVLDQGHLERYADSHRKDFVVHGDHGNTGSLDDDIAAAREERAALPDMRVHVDHVVAENDLVSVTWTASGTNTHEGMGFPATGKRVVSTGMTLFRFEAGKIVEEWSVFDMLSVLTQLGLLPSSSK